MNALFEIERLSVAYSGGGAGNPARLAVRQVDMSVAGSEIIAVIGESGSGKSQCFMAALRLLGTDAHVGGAVRFQGTDLLTLSTAALNRIRGAQIAMIFQDPMSALNPHLDIATQLGEVLVAHRNAGWREARAASLNMLARVRIAEPERRLRQYPHELSGGMRQRVMIAMALMCSPQLLIADEPTTALDSTVQSQIMALLRELQSQTRMAIIFISHDLALAFGFAHCIMVMYAGRVVEKAPVQELFAHALHPYTSALLANALLSNRIPTGPSQRLPSLPGQPPDSAASEIGCAFAPRCPRAQALCRHERPLLEVKAGTHLAACHFPL